MKLEINEKKILILGAQGNLGSQIVREMQLDSKAVISWTREDCDLCDLYEVETKIRKLAPDIIINTVAYNNVDACEKDLKEQSKAILLNIELVGCLAQICNKMNIKLIHFSTNYVFSGNKESYTEYDEPDPINFYGLTKALGEKLILSKVGSGLNACVIRVSNLFGPRGNSVNSKESFFDVIRNAAHKNSCLSVVNDEICCFTYTKDIAKQLVNRINDENFQGIYHWVNSGPASWYEATQAYFELLKYSNTLKPIEGSAYGRPAKRPASAILCATRSSALRHYKLALQEYINDSAVTSSQNE